jgi:hypothetical protein
MKIKSAISRLIRNRARAGVGRCSPTLLILGSVLLSSVFLSANGAHVVGTCAGAVALTAVGPAPCPEPPWSRDGAQFLYRAGANADHVNRSGVLFRGVVILGPEDHPRQGLRTVGIRREPDDRAVSVGNPDGLRQWVHAARHDVGKSQRLGAKE